MQKELAKLTVAVHKAIIANKVYIRSEDKCGAEPIETGFHFQIPRLNDYFIYQLVFDLLYDKFLRESPKLTLNQYCEKRHSDLKEMPNTLNKLMALQIELEFDKVSKNGEVKKGIYDNTELIRDAEEFGCNLAKYSDAFRSQNQSFIGKKSKKASEYKPMLSERIEELKKQGNDTDIVVNLANSWKTADYSRKKEVAMIMINKFIISENGDTKIIWNI